MTYDDWKLCNCAGCGHKLLGESMPAGLERGPEAGIHCVRGRVAGRVRGRPFCAACLPMQVQPPTPEVLT